MRSLLACWRIVSWLLALEQEGDLEVTVLPVTVLAEVLVDEEGLGNVVELARRNIWLDHGGATSCDR